MARRIGPTDAPRWGLLGSGRARLFDLDFLRHIHDRQESLEEDGTRGRWQVVESRIDKRLDQFRTVSLPQTPAAFHELLFGYIATSREEWLKFFDRQAQRPYKLCVDGALLKHGRLSIVLSGT